MLQVAIKASGQELKPRKEKKKKTNTGHMLAVGYIILEAHLQG